MSPLKEEASRNMSFMSVTDETSQEEMSPLKEEASRNISFMSVTDERFGVSVARYIILEAPSKADFIDVHRISPHCSIDVSFRALAGSPSGKKILVKLPDMLTL